MPEHCLAAVSTAFRVTTVREFPIPEVTEDGGLLRIEAAGICGSDWNSYRYNVTPRIMGHENVGRVARIGRIAARKWRLKEGDRIALEEYLPCGECLLCRRGDFRLCEATEISRKTGETPLRYGSTSINVPPSLWGGYSQYMLLHPNSVIHRVDERTPARHLAMVIPISNGIQWTLHDGKLKPGQSVLIQGPGQQGLASVLAAKMAGAGMIIVSGLSRDANRLVIARKFGADHTVNIEAEDLREFVAKATGGAGVDLVIDVAGGPRTLIDSVDCLKKAGIIVFGAWPSKVTDFEPFKWIIKRATVKAARGHSYESVEAAIALVQAGSFGAELLSTHAFGLSEVDLGIRSIGGEGVDNAIHVSIVPE